MSGCIILAGRGGGFGSGIFFLPMREVEFVYASLGNIFNNVIKMLFL